MPFEKWTMHCIVCMQKIISIGSLDSTSDQCWENFGDGPTENVFLGGGYNIENGTHATEALSWWASFGNNIVHVPVMLSVMGILGQHFCAHEKPCYRKNITKKLRQQTVCFENRPPPEGNMYDRILSQKKLEYNQKLQFDVVLGYPPPSLFVLRTNFLPFFLILQLQ